MPQRLDSGFMVAERRTRGTPYVKAVPGLLSLLERAVRAVRRYPFGRSSPRVDSSGHLPACMALVITAVGGHTAWSPPLRPAC